MTDTAADTAEVYLRTVFKHHGISSGLISDRDPKFISAFWRSLSERLGTRLKMSTARVDTP